MVKGKISVVIPAKNEAPTIRSIIKEAKNYAYEVLVIDGNSQDATRRIAQEEGTTVLPDKGTGKGKAVRLGIEKAQGDIVVFIDADGIDKCLRLIGSTIINLIINVRWRQNLTDAQNGFRAIKTPVARSLNLRENTTTIEQEMVMKALRKGYKISEISSHEYARRYGTSVIVLKKVWPRYVYSLIKNLF